MGSEEKMTVDERYKYLRVLHRRYEVASRQERGRLLDEAAAITGLERKYLSHVLNKEGPIRKRRERQRSVVYDGEVKRTVRIVADALDWICAERLQPTLAETALHLAGFGELVVNETLLAKLQEISISSVYRLLKDLRKGEPRLPQRRGRPQGDGVSAEIPMTRLAWDLSEPGHFELDLVHHCGPSARDDYLCTMQWIDVATGWSERVAVYGRSAREMKVAFAKVVSRCPFPISEIHPDNGSEFMNRPLLDFFGKKVTGVKLTRSRPYHKNDNRFVEQKNHTLVRAYLGKERLDTRAQCLLLNRIYDDMWVYYNLFQPVLRQVAKDYERSPEGRLILHRQHDVARTPFERLRATSCLSEQALDDLQAIYEVNNPRALKHTIQEQLEALLLTCKPLSGKEDV
jgi:hypothetical protein